MSADPPYPYFLNGIALGKRSTAFGFDCGTTSGQIADLVKDVQVTPCQNAQYFTFFLFLFSLKMERIDHGNHF